MNNKGFTLSNLLFFISFFMMILVVCVIVIDSNINKFKMTYEEPKIADKEIKIEKEKNVSVIDSNSNKYKPILEKMANTAKIYVSTNYTGSTDQIVIKTSKLISDGYMEELVDPTDNKKCIGYIIYDGESSYTPYLKCSKNYKSENYSETFE